ncbi:MAG: hypothetical protein A4E42_01306 [Methanoregulaceae archaeon PtaU1.Bin222]|nr:MAG: hypothetical protein A4E42_01306 [Methanoregulaceae archaeon PtaU1.Bin222]
MHPGLPGEGWLKGNFQEPFRNRESNMMDSQLNKGPVDCRGTFFIGVVKCRINLVSSRSAPDTGKKSNFLSRKCTSFSRGIPTDLSRMMTHVE